MKAILKVVLIVIALFTSRLAPAQGTVTYLSNLEQPSSGAVSVGSDSWIAVGFFTGGNSAGYVINSVQIDMTDSSGNPSGFSVMLYSGADIFGGILPASNLGTLTGSADPASGAIYSYTSSSGLTLSPGAYFIVVTAATTVANGAYEWSLAGVNSYDSTGGWRVTGGVSSGVFDSSDGSSWTSLSATYPQFAINATAAPEPGVVGLFALGGLLVGFRRWKARAGC